ncbi:hypothetical protein B0T16DRAFT_423941 [Cercophora newfieldiana]|uniref:Uncharacterized protein n=1 Tax=Cercophora newfieldiana TaxID=92897 RepID=A0AA40CIC9_9PEZI|nr:hypothetical protein B0T16DRAFT_423941 [Cercophora newfieldiana]
MPKQKSQARLCCAGRLKERPIRHSQRLSWPSILTVAKMVVSGFIPLAQWAAIFLPTLYVGIAAQDSVHIVNAIKTNTPPKVLAKQWLEVYRQGPFWVIPVVLLSIASNALLALNAPNPNHRILYGLSAILMWSIPLTTIFIFEPGVNGACKIKAAQVLTDEGLKFPDKGSSSLPIPGKHSASPATRAWAERREVGMESVAGSWARQNVGRVGIALVAAGISGFASLGRRSF